MIKIFLIERIQVYSDWIEIIKKKDIMKFYFIEYKAEWKYILVSWKKGDMMKICFIQYKFILIE